MCLGLSSVGLVLIFAGVPGPSARRSGEEGGSDGLLAAETGLGGCSETVENS